ncbi:hypothetical protein KHA80_05730 [Anaerobacillus sp. HL2]|nr:hypothetical protein KHA80_05730 [Anaerobacillus sp. HL2]
MEELAEKGAAEELGKYGHVSIGCSDCHNRSDGIENCRPSLTNALADKEKILRKRQKMK